MKKIFILLLCISIINLTNAQTYDTTTWYGKMSYIFNNVSHTQITTGLLRDYGIDFTNLDNYDGKVVNDTNWVTLPDWRVLYASLYSEQINVPTTMLYLDTVNNLIGKYALPDSVVSFACLYYNYNVLDSDAVTKNLMYIQNGQIYDVVNRTQSPYLLHSAFAIAPTQQQVTTGTNYLILRPELFLSNTGKTISTLQIDPGTGTYQTTSFNTPITVDYDTAGFYAIRLKITYTDSTVNYSHTKLFAVNADSGGLSYNNKKNHQTFTGYGPPYFEEPFIFGTKGGTTYAEQSAYYKNHSVTFTADEQYLGKAATGDYVIDLSVNNTTGQIQKPLIVVSGFDPEAVDNSTGLTYYDDYVQRINSDWNYPTYHPISLNATNGLDNADSYDIIYLHWHNGTDYIERNAYLLEKLIQIVNDIKANNGSTEKNVIIGTSMGGLVARWALRDMELHSIDHDTRLFICDDAPNWGANVPPAYQALVQYIAPWKVINAGFQSQFPYLYVAWSDMFPDAVDGVATFNSPAAKQMLIQRYNLSGQTLTADNSTHTSFMNEINSMGWPVNCKNIILSNGTCNGSTIFSDNSEMVSITGSTGQSWTYLGDIWRSWLMMVGGVGSYPQLLVSGMPVNNLSLAIQFPLSLITTRQNLNFDFEAWAVPTTGTSLIFKGDVSIHRKLLWLLNTTSYILKCHVNSVSGMLPLDNVPGSKYDLSLFNVNIDDINAQLHQQLGNWINANVLQQQFCFVLTVSSIPVSNPQQHLRTSFCDSIACLLPTEVSDYFAPQQNEIHVSYTTDNSNWILQRQDAGFSCALICPSTLSISGDNIVCTTSGNYTIPNLPAGVTVTWTASPTYTVTINSPNSLQTTLTKIANGTITLTAAIGNICGNNTVYINKQVQVGLNTPSFVVNALNYCQGTHFTAIATSNNPGQSISSYNWFVDGSPQSYTGYKLTGTFPSDNNYMELSVSTTNCGTSDIYYVPDLNCSGGYDFIVAPNPASNTVTITTTNTGTTDTTTTLASRNSMVSKTTVAVSQPLIKQVKIVDVGGRLMKQMDYSTPQQQVIIDVTTLNPGIYFVSISGGKSISSKKLLIQR